MPSCQSPPLTPRLGVGVTVRVAAETTGWTRRRGACGTLVWGIRVAAVRPLAVQGRWCCTNRSQPQHPPPRRSPHRRITRHITSSSHSNWTEIRVRAPLRNVGLGKPMSRPTLPCFRVEVLSDQTSVELSLHQPSVRGDNCSILASIGMVCY